MSARSLVSVVAIGEVLWDIFPTGPRFGGAPANFACSMAQLTRNYTEVRMVSCVGHDDLGKRALESLERHRVITDQVSRVPQPTGQVHIELDSIGRASYRFAENCAWDNLEWSSAWGFVEGNPTQKGFDDRGSSPIQNRLRAPKIVCFGTLGQRSLRSRTTIQRFVAAVPKSTWRLYDVNLRPPFDSPEIILASLPLANVLKLNDDELPVVARLCGFSGSPRDILRHLSTRYGFHAIALTCGERGGTLMRGEEYFEGPGLSVDVVDTVGAGDAFAAAFIWGIFHRLPLDVIHTWATRVAAFVCSQPGATPTFPEEWVDGLQAVISQSDIEE